MVTFSKVATKDSQGYICGWAMQLLSVTVQRGNAEMYCQSGLDW